MILPRTPPFLRFLGNAVTLALLWATPVGLTLIFGW